MNNVFLNLLTAFKNPHIRWSLLAAAVCEVGAVWLPNHAEQFKETQKIFGAYALLAAANSAPAVPDQGGMISRQVESNDLIKKA